jgi:hypothetical protein
VAGLIWREPRPLVAHSCESAVAAGGLPGCDEGGGSAAGRWVMTPADLRGWRAGRPGIRRAGARGHFDLLNHPDVWADIHSLLDTAAAVIIAIGGLARAGHRRRLAGAVWE